MRHLFSKAVIFCCLLLFFGMNMSEPLPVSAVTELCNELSIMNIYESRHAMPEDVKITSLRIVQVLPKSNPGRNNPAIGYAIEKNARVKTRIPPMGKGAKHVVMQGGKLFVSDYFSGGLTVVDAH